MREKILEYVKNHNKFCPSFDLIFTGRQAVISIKHYGTDRNVGHIKTDYGLFFWFRLGLAIKKCFKEQVK